MRNILFPLAAILLAGSAVAADRRVDDAEKFAKAVAGLTPGKPMNCLSARLGTAGLTAIGPRLIYRVSKRLSYVNETSGGCEGVARGDILVTRSFTGGLCRGDIAQTVHRGAPVPTGGCSLGKFVPYTKG